MAASAKPQLEMVVDDPVALERELDAEATADVITFTSVIAACRDVALTLGYDKVANALDRTWSKQGRPVSASFLRAALNPDNESRSYFRFEWAPWFARRSAELRDLLVEIAIDTPKDPAEDLDDLHDVLREELGKTGEALIRKAKARRRRKR